MLNRVGPAAFFLLAALPASASAQSAGAPAAQPETPTQSTASSYRINAGDELEIYVWGEERLQRTVKVLPDGTIAFPLVGQIEAEGRLPQEIETTIHNGLQEQYRGQVPQVTVSVLSPAGLHFSVLGKVRSPGSYTPGRFVNVLEALSLAGGPNEFAKVDKILVIRNRGGQLSTRRVDLAALLKGGSDAEALANQSIARLETGDMIIVP